jgi:hypothetical protein
MKDFFISYNSADKQWAEWIALALVTAGRTVTIQAWDFLPGSNFVLEMHRAALECDRTIAVLSPDWLASVFTQPEWAAAFSLDPTGTDRKLLPVRVRVCELPGLLRSIVYCDLVGRDEDGARKALLDAIREAPARPMSVPFPGGSTSTTAGSAEQVRYPGAVQAAPVAGLPSPLQAALTLLGLLRTTRTTFIAQANLRDRLVWHVQDRLILNPYDGWEYEEFISDHYKDLDSEERRMFSTMRSFTANVLREYNRRVLKLIDENPVLEKHFPAVPALRDHLLVWLAKYDGTFVNTPEMCLLYTGVHEGVPFPSELEPQLWQFLEEQPEARSLLKAEPGSPLEHEEHTSSWRSSEGDKRLFDRWIQRRFREIPEERQRLLNRASTVEPAEAAAGLRALDVEEADLIDRRMYPQMIWRPIIVPAALVAALQALLDGEATNKWPEEFREALAAAVPVVNNPTPGSSFELKKLVGKLPAICSYVESLAIRNNVPSEWAHFRGQLRDWVLAGLRPDR